MCGECQSSYRWFVFRRGEASVAILKFQSFWDDSGTEHVVTMAGYVASVEQWDLFDNAWNAVLSEFCVPRSHMTDFVAKQGDFAGPEWDDDDRRKRFIEGLIRAIRDSELRAICSSIHVEALKKANAHWGVHYSEYAVAAALTMTKLRDSFPEESCRCLLDRITDGRAAQLEMAEDILSRHPLYCKWWRSVKASGDIQWRHLEESEQKQNYRGLEAADLYAWECRAYAEQFLGLQKHPGSHWTGYRISLIELGKLAHNGQLFSDDALNLLYYWLTTGKLFPNSPVTAPSA